MKLYILEYSKVKVKIGCVLKDEVLVHLSNMNSPNITTNNVKIKKFPLCTPATKRKLKVKNIKGSKKF